MSTSHIVHPPVSQHVSSGFSGCMSTRPGGSEGLSDKALIHLHSSPQKVGVFTGGWEALSGFGLIHPQSNHVLRRVSPFGGMTLFAVNDPTSRVHIRHTASQLSGQGG